MKKEYSVNKYQFGTVMPGSQPVAFEYQPLGLEAFAQPIAQRQKMFDVTLDALDSASFNIDGLEVDKESSDKLNAELVEHKDFLMQQLQETGNYKDVARRLKKLNKVYNEDAEISGIRQQKANFLAEAKKQRERIDGDKFTQKMYNEWEKKALFDYTKEGGYNYDRSTGKHNSISVTPRGDNLESEFMDLSIKLAGDAGIDGATEFQRSILPGLEEAIITAKVKGKTKDEIANEIYNFMKKSDRYQTYLDETAEYEFFNLNQGNVNSENIRVGIERMEKAFDSEISGIDVAIANTNDNVKKQELLDRRKELQESKANIQKTEEETMLLGEDSYYKFAENAYAATFSSEFQQDLANAAGELFAETKIDLSYKIPGKKGYEKRKENLNEEVNTADVTTVALSDQAKSVEGVEGTTVMGGGGDTGTDYNVYEAMQLETKNKEAPENIISKEIYDNKTNRTINNVLDEADNENLASIDLGTGIIPSNTATAFKDAKYNAIRAHGVLDVINNYKNNIKEQDAIILANEEKLKGNISIEQKAKYNAAIRVANRRKEKEGEGYESAMLKLNNSIKELSTKAGNEWMLEAFDKNGYEGIYQELYDRNLNRLERYKQGSKNLTNDLEKIIRLGAETHTVDIPIMEDGRQAIHIGLEQSGGGSLTTTKEVKIFNKNLVKDQINAANNKDYFTNVEDESIGSANIALKDWQWQKKTEEAVIPKAIQVNDEADKFSGGKLKNIISLIKNEGSASDVPIRQVNFTGLGKSTKYTNDLKKDTYNLGNYSDVPLFVGQFDIGEDGVISNIFKYSRKSKENELSVKTQILASQGKKATEDNLKSISDKEVKEFTDANPKDLYISVEGTSDDVVQEARNIYAVNAAEAIDLGDVNAFNSTIGSMAALDALTYSNREAYAGLSSELAKIQELGDTKDVVTQTPAIWNNIGEGLYEGYSIDYIFDKDEGMKALISLTTVNTNTNETKETAVNSFVLSKMDPQTLRGMDMIYGTGSSESIINDEGGNPFIPAFRNSGLASQYNN